MWHISNILGMEINAQGLMSRLMAPYFTWAASMVKYSCILLSKMLARAGRFIYRVKNV